LNQEKEWDLELRTRIDSGFYSSFIIIIFSDLSDWCYAGILITEKESVLSTLNPIRDIQSLLEKVRTFQSL